MRKILFYDQDTFLFLMGAFLYIAFIFGFLAGAYVVHKSLTKKTQDEN